MDKREAKWQARLAELRAFRRRFGHCRVPKGWSENPALALWVHNQRALAARRALRPERRDRLDRLGVDWRVRTKLPWETMYERLREFRRRHGHADVPWRWHDARLRNWVGRQRHFYRTARLPTERRQKLLRLGFRFRVHAKRRSFEEGLAQLRARLPGGPPRRARLHDRSLDIWLSNLRARRHRLTPSQRRALQRLGVPIETHAERWEDMLERLRRFRARHGHVRVPWGFAPDPTLGRWVTTQRIRYREGKLAPERRARLQALGFFDSVDR